MAIINKMAGSQRKSFSEDMVNILS